MNSFRDEGTGNDHFSMWTDFFCEQSSLLDVGDRDGEFDDDKDRVRVGDTGDIVAST